MPSRSSRSTPIVGSSISSSRGANESARAIAARTASAQSSSCRPRRRATSDPGPLERLAGATRRQLQRHAACEQPDDHVVQHAPPLAGGERLAAVADPVAQPLALASGEILTVEAHHPGVGTLDAGGERSSVERPERRMPHTQTISPCSICSETSRSTTCSLSGP